jgi:hypothetical protein
MSEGLRQPPLFLDDGGALSDDELLKLPRHRMRLFRGRLEKLLSEPIRANRLEASDEKAQREKRAAFERGQVESRICALFAYYNVPDILSEDEQWRWLAMALAGDKFAGCRTLHRGLGGPRKATLWRMDDLKQQLFLKFEDYKRQRPGLKDRSVAEIFLKSDYRTECQAAGFADAKSLAQAMQSIRKKKALKLVPPGTSAV